MPFLLQINFGIRDSLCKKIKCRAHLVLSGEMGFSTSGVSYKLSLMWIPECVVGSRCPELEFKLVWCDPVGTDLRSDRRF